MFLSSMICGCLASAVLVGQTPAVLLVVMTLCVFFRFRTGAILFCYLSFMKLVSAEHAVTSTQVGGWFVLALMVASLPFWRSLGSGQVLRRDRQ